VARSRQRNGDRTHADQIHLPGNSALPLFAAIGITVALLGLILWWPFVAAGSALLLFTAWRWIKAARQEYEELPRG
jgi:hypothetical protein